VILSFGDKATDDFFHGRNTRQARALVPSSLKRRALARLEILTVAASLDDLKVVPGYNLEALLGNLKGFWSIRINEQYRVIFRWDHGAGDVRILDYH
jgi:proteic killer suppression protein